jgi:TetR/AcrR family transcriptional regulator, mexJK operon transcriptional repressor
MSAKPHLIVKGRKFDQVLDGARTVFMRDGFERASVDDIAREAGVSKATLYAYFPDKRILFMEIASTECRRQAEEAASQIDFNAPIAQILSMVAAKIIGFMQSDFGRRIFRIAVAESESFPALAEQFYRSGPQLVKERIAVGLRCGVDRGELVIDDIPLAASQFAQLCKVDLQDRLLFTADTGLSPAEEARLIDSAVTMFLARYAKKP